MGDGDSGSGDTGADRAGGLGQGDAVGVRVHGGAVGDDDRVSVRRTDASAAGDLYDRDGPRLGIGDVRSAAEGGALVMAEGSVGGAQVRGISGAGGAGPSIGPDAGHPDRGHEAGQQSGAVSLAGRVHRGGWTERDRQFPSMRMQDTEGLARSRGKAPGRGSGGEQGRTKWK